MNIRNGRLRTFAVLTTLTTLALGSVQAGYAGQSGGSENSLVGVTLRTSTFRDVMRKFGQPDEVQGGGPFLPTPPKGTAPTGGGEPGDGGMRMPGSGGRGGGAAMSPGSGGMPSAAGGGMPSAAGGGSGGGSGSGPRGYPSKSGFPGKNDGGPPAGASGAAGSGGYPGLPGGPTTGGGGPLRAAIPGWPRAAVCHGGRRRSRTARLPRWWRRRTGRACRFQAAELREMRATRPGHTRLPKPPGGITILAKAIMSPSSSIKKGESSRSRSTARRSLHNGKTRQGIMLGSNMTQVLSRYGWSGEGAHDGENVIMRYGSQNKVAFQMVKNRVLGITVAVGH